MNQLFYVKQIKGVMNSHWLVLFICGVLSNERKKIGKTIKMISKLG